MLVAAQNAVFFTRFMLAKRPARLNDGVRLAFDILVAVTA
jgi:hypothetical protein